MSVMTPSAEAVTHLLRELTALLQDPKRSTLADLRGVLSRAYSEGRRAGIGLAVEVVSTQPNYPDTKIGMRQNWVKEQIAAWLRALADEEGGTDGK